MASTPTLRVDTSNSPFVIDGNSPSASPSSPKSPSFGTFTKDRARSISQSVLPSFRISSVGDTKSNISGPSASKQAGAPGANRARNESRKLLSHILSQLQSRPLPPPYLSTLVYGAGQNDKGSGSVMKSMKGAVKYTGTLRERRTHQPLPQDGSDSEDERQEGFSPDITIDLLNQLKDVLTVSNVHGWDIFYDSAPQNQRSNSEKLRDSFMRRRSGSVGRSRSRSPSVGRGDSEGAVRAPQLLSQCISILGSIIAEDCRYKVAARPSRPPNSLQFIVLDVARFLLHTHRHDPTVIAQIGFILLPAFLTFSPEMHTRLLAFFEDGVIGNTLADLRALQGTRQLSSPSADLSYNDSMSINEPPMVSILVDEVHEESAVAHNETNWRRWTRALSPDDVAIRSTSAPLQDIAIYHLSSIIPPLLAAILESIDLPSSSSGTLHRFHRLLSRIAESKPDTYLDALAVIAYHTPRARHAAVSLLLSYWPHAIGHLTISKTLPSINYQEAIVRETQGAVVSRRLQSHPYSHQFVPWRFPKASGPAIFAGTSHSDCHSCTSPIEGFGLFCPLCMCMVHFNCYDYPDGSFFTQYSVAADSSMQKIAVHRFCHVLPQRHATGPEVVHKAQHAFRAVNLFSLTLCFICRNPLWGHVLQALKCSSCNQFVHAACLTKATSSDLQRCRTIVIDDTYMTISWKALRKSFADHYREVFLTEADLPLKTYEELSVFLAVLWIQLQILANGLALGSIVVQQGSSSNDDGQMDEFELHYLVNLYEAYLSSRAMPLSQALSDHFAENRLRAPDTHIFFDWNVLTFILSVIKAPASQSDGMNGSSADLLTASQPGNDRDSSLDDGAYPYEMVTLAHLRDQLGDELNLHSEAAARYLLSHLFHLGFFQRVDSHGNLFDGGPHPERLQCSFPVPIGLEVSTEVETLVASIEACLSDIDLSINEAGLLLLVRKFWPDGMLTDYALRRLSKAVLAWIVSEDDDLATMLRDYVARGLSLPGVRSGVDVQPWPTPTYVRPTAASSANNGGDYVAGRRALSSRYAARWLLALHDLDVDAYAVMVFDLLVEQAQDLPVSDEFFLGKGRDTVEKREATITEKILHLILKLSQVSVLFTAFDDLFQKWLDRASSLNVDEQIPFASLSRLFNRELDTGGSARFSAIAEPRLTMSDNSSLLAVNPLKVITDIATKSHEGYDNTLHWLCLFVRSGVEISIPTFMHLVELGNRFGVSLEVCSLLIKATLWSCWLKSMGRQDLQSVVAAIHVGIGPQLVSYLQARHREDEVLQIIRQSLATCLLLYGCEREFLLSSGLVLETEIRGLPSRRKLHGRAATVTDPVIVNSALIDALKTYVETGLEEVSCITAKFLDAFMHHAPLVESYEVDNFILRNGSSLCTCVWQFYAVQTAKISTIRTGVLLRVLVVDAQPFQSLLQHLFERFGSWELRMQAITRLFRIIEDVTSPTFVVEDRQWRSSVIDVFRYFFGALWEDEREEIRLAVDTWTQTLLVAHFDAIALCWDEALVKSPVSDRTKLVSFLSQLRPHFPQWRLLSWDVILEALLESEFIQRNGDDEDGPMSAHLSMYGLPSASRQTMLVDPDLQTVQNSLVSLSLRMIAEGIPIEVNSLLKLKEHLARTLGFVEVAMIAVGNTNNFFVKFGSLDTVPEPAYPCLNELMLALDSAQPYNLLSSSMGGRYSDDEVAASLLVGSIFVDLFLETFIHCNDIESIPSLILKNMLKTLIIVIYKHDFDSRPLKPFQGQLRRAVKRALDLLLVDLSYDIRQLVLTACHAFIKRWPHLIGNFVVESIESTMTIMEKMDYLHNGDDVLIDQTRNFLRTILGLYAFSGVFYLLCKRRHSHDFFEVVKHLTGPHVKAEHNPHPRESLRDALLRDTFSRAVEGDDESLQVVVDNLNTYVEVVHHAGYTLSLMQFVGSCLLNLARKTADLHHARFDPSPLLVLACTLIQHNKAHSRDLLSQLDILLRSSLIRFNVSVASLRRVLHVTTTLYRKAAKVAGNNENALVNPLAAAMLELSRDGLNMKARVTPATLAALVEALTATPDRGSAKVSFIPLEEQLHLAHDGLSFLIHESGGDGFFTFDFTTSQAVAKMILQGAEIQASLMQNLHRRPMAVRGWNNLALAALSRPSGTSAAMLFEHFSTFSLAYNLSISQYQSVQMLDNSEAQDRAHADISYAYAAIKLWLLLARKASIGHSGVDATGALQDAEGIAAKMVWNELWPPFEAVITAFEMDAHGGNVLPLVSSMWTSVADLFLFVRQSRSVIALDTTVPARILNRLKDVVRGESKVSRVVRSLKDSPPDDSLEYFINQVTTEITAEEKLQAAKRQINMEKGRRVAI
ncbi:hypothetical protein K466DRAFT_545801 [Polyporus arcularius HHB13444]|uniref:Phorbol-ester/DAG-type domain-containing protein n=1 Tax=Polyporus arcularius HHB13444 TaxID=1314778 RepID=A0A5C3PHW6_9APHY|nr:hypothetical protein K466DRAFT_545801 [Polyporus arcularius HHB13444]